MIRENVNSERKSAFSSYIIHFRRAKVFKLGHSNLSKPDPFCGIIINPWLGVGMICAGNGPVGFTRIFGPERSG